MLPETCLSVRKLNDGSQAGVKSRILLFACRYFNWERVFGSGSVIELMLHKPSCFCQYGGRKV